jgi:hypothetical protein
MIHYGTAVGDKNGKLSLFSDTPGGIKNPTGCYCFFILVSILLAYFKTQRHNNTKIVKIELIFFSFL